MAIKFEQTDTFCGEANYSWVKRHDYTGKNDSNLALVRAAKAWAGWQGVRCDVSIYGETIEIRPSGFCQVLFILTKY